MRTIKVADATPLQLNWLVAKCEDWEDYNDDGVPYVELDSSHMARRFGPFSPSTDWSQGGPIIEREKIAIDWSDSNDWCASVEAMPFLFFAERPLIAALCVYVASKLGETVEVPEELL